MIRGSVRCPFGLLPENFHGKCERGQKPKADKDAASYLAGGPLKVGPQKAGQ